MASLLKSVNLQGIERTQISSEGTKTSQSRRLVFWINIYHTLMLHSRLMLGTARSPYRHYKQAKTTSYEIFAEPYRNVYSLTEIEHCILRAKMSRPVVPASGFFLPECVEGDIKWELALLKAEPRLNFVINYGTVSCLPLAPVFTMPLEEGVTADKVESILNAQLDASSRSYLQNFVLVNCDQGTIILPKVLDWYWRDFVGDDKPPKGLGAKACVLKTAHRLLQGMKRKKISFLIAGGDKRRSHPVSIK